MPALLLFSEDYSDEFDAEGYCILSDEDYRKFLRCLEDTNLSKKEFEYSFGSNEFVYYQLKGIKHQVITPIQASCLMMTDEYEYKNFMKWGTPFRFGQFPDIIDDVSDFVDWDKL